eukprot:2460868-Pyramimonas_sp.AAC.1
MSDKERLRSEGPPSLECTLKTEGGGEKVRPRLLEHLRRRGRGPRASATTGLKGPYRAADVIARLGRHLPH